MIVNIKKGYEDIDVELNNVLDVLMPANLPSGLDEEALVKDSLNNPIGSDLLRNKVKKGDKVCIVTSDVTRPMPSWRVLPSVIEELEKGGVERKNIFVIFARGSHRNQSIEEHKHLMGKMYGAIDCFDSNSEDLVHLGYTSNHTPVDIDRRVVEADVRICLGNVEYHYFAGYSGGYKAIMPGVSSIEAITNNHRLMIDERSCAGNLEGNPVRMDIEEAGRILGVDFIVNVVLNTKKEIIYVASGDPVKAHRDACKYLDSIYLSYIDKKADIVLVSMGGAPKDLNLYQTQKALDNAKHAVRDGGVVILVGACDEGFGSALFEEWMLRYQNPDDMIAELHRNFRLGAHKATAIAMLRKRADICFVSNMDKSLIDRTFLRYCASVDEALSFAYDKLGRDASIIVMPYGGSTLPKIM